ncbi:acetylcholine receptor subunit beta-type unc-29-like [Saccostrea echinata]|uniref:acetylcholine receptor subunit beta-type unc-29-like n=1 Tax=Saccostrea echinata TaxID=191078 RepID=UPI002A82EF7D|nr:acetylcholine receptor subunit beta-type unc-29-like [Saccostrea echinata]
MKKNSLLCWFLLLISGMTLTSVYGSMYSDVETLLQDVFKNYSSDIRPKENFSEVLEVSLQPFMFSVNEFDEVSGVMSIVCGFFLTWHDFRLTWTPSNYGGIQDIPVPKQKLWVPNIFLIDPANKMEAVGSDDFIGRISYSGAVSWVPGGLIQTLCNVNMYKFPFDVQTCSFTLVLWGYSQFEAKLTPFNNFTFVDTTYYTPNAQWTLEKTVMKPSALGGYDNLIEIQLILKRKSLYFVINMLAPILLLSLLNPLVFALPVESGERVSYAITIFLSFAVFMTLLSDSMPKSSEPMSLMSYFLIVTMSMSTLICVLAVVTMRLHFKNPKLPVSSRCVFMLNVLRLRCLCHICRKRKKKSKVIDTSSKLDVVFVKSKMADDKNTQDNEKEEKVTWKILAKGYDKIMTYYFYILVFLQWVILGVVLAV